MSLCLQSHKKTRLVCDKVRLIPAAQNILENRNVSMYYYMYEPRQEKSYPWGLRPGKIQINPACPAIETS